MTTSASEKPTDPLFRVSSAEYGPKYGSHLLAQYKLAVERADAVSERRATTNEFYLILVSVILSVAGIGIGGTFVGTPVIPPKVAPWVSAVGIVVCVSWLAAIYSSNQLNRAKFRVINRLEEKLPAAVFTVEWRYRTTGSDQPVKDAGRLYTSATVIESIIPTALFALFLGLTVYLLL